MWRHKVAHSGGWLESQQKALFRNTPTHPCNSYPLTTRCQSEYLRVTRLPHLLATAKYESQYIKHVTEDILSPFASHPTTAKKKKEMGLEFAAIRRWSFPRRKKSKKSDTFDSVDSHILKLTVISNDGMDGWTLFLHLENTFGIDNFKIEQRCDSYRVWAPEEVSHQDIDRCKLTGSDVEGFRM